MKIHPSDLLLEEVLSSPQGGEPSLRHHVAGCPYCRSRLAAMSNLATWRTDLAAPSRGALGAGIVGLFKTATCKPGAPADYGPAIERSERKYCEHARVIHQERAEAPGLLADLLAEGPEKSKLLLATSPRLQTWGVYELLLQRSWQLRTVSRTLSEGLARLALDLSSHLDSSYYRPEMIEDLRSRAWSYIGNLRRIAMDLDSAKQAFQTSYAHLKLGTREPIERALFLDLKATLRGAQRRFDEAVKLVNRAIAIFFHYRDDHRAGKSLVSLAATYSAAGRIAEAVPVLERALALIDPDQDERLFLCAWHNLIDDLAMLGRFIEAQRLYRRARDLYSKNKDRDKMLDLKRIWVKGKIERGLGRQKSSESLFLAAREGFLAEDLPYEAALVSLELATLYAEQHRTTSLKRLATEILSIFTSRHIHREALAALILFVQAIRRPTPTA